MKVNIAGVLVDQTTMRDGLGFLKPKLSGNGHYVVTPNPEFVVRAWSDSHFRNILNYADLSIPDGIGLIWAGKILGTPFSERVAGADFGEALVGLAAESGQSVFFLGGRGDVAKLAAENLQKKYPTLIVAGFHSGEASEQGDEENRSRIGDSHIGLLLVAYGHPKQEYWIERNLPKLNIGLAMGVGGSFDFWSGDTPRAPRWVRRAGLEWLFRLIRQPWRLKRQLALITFIYLVLKQRFLR